MGQEKRRNVGGEVSQPGRGRPEGAGNTAVRRLGGDRVDKEPDTALLPSSKDVQEVKDEHGRMLPLRTGSRNLPPHAASV